LFNLNQCTSKIDRSADYEGFSTAKSYLMCIDSHIWYLFNIKTELTAISIFKHRNRQEKEKLVFSMHFKVQGEIQRDEIWKFLERFHEAQGFRSVLSECQEDKCEV